MLRFGRLEPLFASRPTKDRTYKCHFCPFTHRDKKTMGQHYDNKHKDLIPGDTDGYRWFYFHLTGKERGACIMCKGETEFNRETMKYCRFCDNKACKEEYREIFKQRMIGKYGKIHLLDDPEMQKKMLAGRRISGIYEWSTDPEVKIGYTGSYELDFLKKLDLELKWKHDDILMPSPHIFTYQYQDKDHFYMPDAFIPSLNLEIEIKDDGSALNINEDSRAKDILKDELMKSNAGYFRYIKIIGKDYQEFLDLVKEGSPDG